MYLKYGKRGAARPRVSQAEAMELAVKAFQKAFDEDKKRRTMNGEIIPFDRSRGKMSTVAAEKIEANEVVVAKPRQDMSNPFASVESFEAAQRMAMALSKGSLIPSEYQNNIPNCLIALEISQRLNSSVLMVMQNLYVVHGKPGWSAQYIISAINSCKKFSPLRFVFNPEKSECTAVATDLKSGEVVKGTKITWTMAIAEGWVDKKGSKWKTMPEQMFMYRAASFFGKAYVPEILMGFQTVEELEDIHNSKFVASEVVDPPKQFKAPNPNEAQITRLYSMASAAGLNHSQVKELILQDYGKTSTKDLTIPEYEHFCANCLQLEEAHENEIKPPIIIKPVAQAEIEIIEDDVPFEIQKSNAPPVEQGVAHNPNELPWTKYLDPQMVK